MASAAERADRLQQLAAMRGRAEAQREDMMSVALAKKLRSPRTLEEGEIEDTESSEVVVADIGPATVNAEPPLLPTESADGSGSSESSSSVSSASEEARGRVALPP